MAGTAGFEYKRTSNLVDVTNAAQRVLFLTESRATRTRVASMEHHRFAVEEVPTMSKKRIPKKVRPVPKKVCGCQILNRQNPLC